jgi:chromate transport protein ChrA
MRRYRLQVVLVALVFGVGAAIVLANVDVRRVLPIILALMAFWFLVYMPRWRRKVRQRARSLPHWQLHPE